MPIVNSNPPGTNKPFGEQPPMPPGPPRKQGLVGRLFGVGGGPKPAADSGIKKPEPLAPAPKKSWEPVNVSDGRFKSSGLHNINKFRHGMNKDLKGIFRKSSERGSFIDKAAKLRSGGISNQEMKRLIKDARKEGMPKWKADQLRRKFGVH